MHLRRSHGVTEVISHDHERWTLYDKHRNKRVTYIIRNLRYNGGERLFMHEHPLAMYVTHMGYR